MWQNVFQGPLTGIRVLDLTVAIAGPSATQLLGFMGAEVIRVSSAAHHRRAADANPAANNVMLNKLSARLNLAVPEGLALAKRLVAISDVVFENQRPNAVERLGLGYDALRQVRPDIISVSLNTSGNLGLEQKIGNAPVFAALSGVGHVSGYAGGPPAEYVNWPDVVSGCWAVFGVLYALHYRQRTGEGQRIDVSAQESLTSLMGDVLMEQAMNHGDSHRDGNGDTAMAPHGCYSCAGEDEWISIAIGSDGEWRTLIEVMGQPGLANDARFSTGLARWRNRDELDIAIGEWTRHARSEDLTKLLQHAGIAAVPVWGSAGLLADPHLRAQGRWPEVDHPLFGRKSVMGPPWIFSGTPAVVRSAAPITGEHEEYVYSDLLGLSGSAVARAIAENVIY